jgi:predicted Zn finger-like uncharacterized protein
MIVTCASCLTKFNLDDSKILAKGTKVRCSRCKHVFYVVPPPETKEEVSENFETFAKYHEDRFPEQGEEAGASPAGDGESRTDEPPSPGEDLVLPPAEASTEKIFEDPLPVGEKKPEAVESARQIRIARAGRRGPTAVFALVIVLLLIVFGVFYISTELKSRGTLFSYLDQPVKKVTQVWHRLWGTENEGLTVGDFTRSEEMIGGRPVSVIEGRVNNQSGFTKKSVRVKVVIYDRERKRVAEREAVCGRSITRGELKNMPSDSFKESLILKPRTEEEMMIPAGKSAPFTVIFGDLPPEAKEFKVEIMEAPNL